MSTQPILLLTFAKNDLKNVSTEAAQLRQIVAQQSQVEGRLEEDLTALSLNQAVSACGNRFWMYHFSGHLSPTALELDDFQKLDSVSFSRILKHGQENLSLVFLNGCRSYGHIAQLTAKGVKALIVSNTSIGDKMAMKLASEFYDLFLLKGYPLQSAFEAASAATVSGYKPNTIIVKPGELDVVPLSHAQWILVIHNDHKAVADWKLADFIHPPKNSKIPRLLTQTAGNPSYFLGREADLEAIKQAFSVSLQPLFLVNGEGGIGKTTLAARYWHLQQKHYKHLGWLNAAFGVKNALLSLAIPFGIRFEPTDTQDVQIKKVTQQLLDLEAPVLLVLDNADNSADLKAHFTVLQQFTNCHVLVTTRVHKLADARVHPVKPFSETEALILFAHHYKSLINKELSLLKSILEAVGYNTLVVELLAKNLNVLNSVRPNAYPIAQLLEDLQTKGLLAIRNKTIDVFYQSPTLREAKPQEIIRAMYDLHPLSAECVYLLSNFSVLPSVTIPFETFCDLLQPADEDAFEDNLTDLRQKGWIRFEEKEGFKMSPVVQAVVRDKNKEPLRTDCDTLVDNLGNKLESDTLHEENYKHSTVFVEYSESVVKYFTKPNSDIAILNERIGTFHTEMGNLETALTFYEAALKLWEELYSSFPLSVDFKNGLAISYSKLGGTYTAVGQLPTALKFYEADLKLCEELYASFPLNVGFKNGLAISYGKLGKTHAALGQLPTALKFYEERRKLGEELYSSFPSNVDFKNGLAIAYSKLGETHAALGQLPTALIFFEDFSRLFEELYTSVPSNVDFKNGLAISYSRLGETHAALGQLPTALKFYEEHQKLGKELYTSIPSNVGFKNSLAISYSQLGETHAALGQLRTALMFYEEHRKLGEELYSSFPSNVDFKNGLAISYSRLGETHAALGQLLTALKFYEERRKLSEELYSSFPSNVRFKNGLATAYSRLGGTHAALGQLSTALTFYEGALKLCEDLYAHFPSNVDFKNGLAIAYEKLGETHAQLGQLTTALKYYEDETVLFEELYVNFPSNVSFKNGLAISYYKLGAIYKKLDKERDIAHFHAAEKLWIELAQEAPEYVEYPRNLRILQKILAELTQPKSL